MMTNGMITPLRYEGPFCRRVLFDISFILFISISRPFDGQKRFVVFVVELWVLLLRCVLRCVALCRVRLCVCALEVPETWLSFFCPFR